jgi:hypothetical protein
MVAFHITFSGLAKWLSDAQIITKLKFKTDVEFTTEPPILPNPF